MTKVEQDLGEKGHNESQDTLRDLKASARNFALSKIFQDEVNESEKNPFYFPKKFLDHCATEGLFGMAIPEDYGGAGLTFPQETAVIEELARGDSGLALSVIVQNSLSAYPIRRFGTKEQKIRYLPLFAKGEQFGCFALTEPEYGSDATNIQLSAVWDDKQQGWWIDGEKRFITNADRADLIVLAARTDEPKSGKHGITIFLVQTKENDGKIKVGQPQKKLGHHGSSICDIVFDHAFVSKQNVLGEQNKGWEIVSNLLERTRILIATLGVGISLRAIDEAEAYMRARRQFDKFLIDIPVLSDRLMILQRQVALAQYLVHKAATQAENTDPKARFWSSLAKFVSGTTTPWVAEEALYLQGGTGYMHDTVASRLYRDAPAINLFGGTLDIHKQILERVIDKERLSPLIPQKDIRFSSFNELPALSTVISDIEGWNRVLLPSWHKT